MMYYKTEMLKRFFLRYHKLYLQHFFLFIKSYYLRKLNTTAVFSWFITIIHHKNRFINVYDFIYS